MLFLPGDSSYEAHSEVNQQMSARPMRANQYWHSHGLPPSLDPSLENFFILINIKC